MCNCGLSQCPRPIIDDNWHARGELPPVGEKVFSDMDGYEHCTVRCHLMKGTAVAEYDDGSIVILGADCFRPIQSERDKVIDAAFEVLSGCKFSFKKGEVQYEIVSKLYDAGMLKLPTD